ncbi:MAG: YbjN domain-containing protein [Pseudomonadota bacterium]
MKGLISALALAVAANVSYAEPSPIVRLDNPAAVALALRDEGFRAKLTTDDRNRPVIETGVGGIYFSIKFFGCDSGIDCYSLLFSAWFDLPNGIGLQPMNEWNADAFMGRAFTNSNCDPVIDHYIFVDQLREVDHFAEEIEYWGEVLADFRDYVYDEDRPNQVASCGGDEVL